MLNLSSKRNDQLSQIVNLEAYEGRHIDTFSFTTPYEVIAERLKKASSRLSKTHHVFFTNRYLESDPITHPVFLPYTEYDKYLIELCDEVFRQDGYMYTAIHLRYPAVIKLTAIGVDPPLTGYITTIGFLLTERLITKALYNRMITTNKPIRFKFDGSQS